MMKYCIFFVVLCAFACSGNKYPGVPERYHTLLNEALSKADDNAVELNKALDSCDARYKEGVAFLIAYMPERDLKELKSLQAFLNMGPSPSIFGCGMHICHRYVLVHHRNR